MSDDISDLVRALDVLAAAKFAGPAASQNWRAACESIFAVREQGDALEAFSQWAFAQGNNQAT